MRASPLLSAALAACLAAGPAIAAAPVTAAAPGDRPAPGSDEAELWFAMERIETDLRQSPRLVRDPALNDYVRGVACKIAQDYCADLRVYIVDLPWFNASMAPNGMLVVWTGALLRMQNEADLALVLGHEFGHYRERHTLQQWRKLKKSSAFLSTFGVLTAGVGLGVAGMVADVAGAAGLSKFSRDKEREADQVGFSRVVAEGYDPHSGVALWEGMLREENARDYGKPVPAFASHPQTRERRDDLASAAEAVTHPGTELGRARYVSATAPFLAHWLENELSRRMFATSIQVIDDLRAKAPDELRGLYTFYLGEAHRRRHQPQDLTQADALYAEAITEPGAPPAAWREYGLVRRADGDRAAARQSLNHYLELDPDAEDRAFVASYLTELEKTP